MLAVGVDIIEVARIEQAVARHGERFYRRFFTARERDFCQGRATSLAGRFAVKEAVAKAMGTGIGDFNWTDIEVVCDGRGKPELVLHNKAHRMAEAKGLQHWSISLSHTETHAIGFAVALRAMSDEQ
ncbi:MAG: holo-ACP synthase [Chloroflexi bacterium]|nr:holo-ACP synthase [Chloroflexota bacterium]MCI0576574.1 holo-ACP synthase [Chloroflexota bacterium]MCI0643795.1 holo-ACP synthase [Chloroflexota bacterium]MCI0726908.1 holo-ACP synthase [Chloroflexota bacterium]